MTDWHLNEQVETATSYHELYVPALMQDWAPRVADAANIRPGDRVLDIACGTGVLTREAASRALPGGTVAGLDLNAGMLAVAAKLSPTLQWHQGTADALPFPDQSFDVVVSQFGLMFFPDPIAALREMVRVLVPGGRLTVAVWASLADTPAFAAEAVLVERLAGVVAGDALRAPFALGDVGRLQELCFAAGITEAQIGLHPGQARFPSIRFMVEADLRDWLPLVGIVLREELIAEILCQAEATLQPYVSSHDRAVIFATPALLLSAVKPSSEPGHNRQLSAAVAV